jgi:hypothetical protein
MKERNAAENWCSSRRKRDKERKKGEKGAGTERMN